jgi:hypothetical protein
MTTRMPPPAPAGPVFLLASRTDPEPARLVETVWCICPLDATALENARGRSSVRFRPSG